MSHDQLQHQVNELNTVNWWHWIVHAFGGISLWCIGAYAKLNSRNLDEKLMSDVSRFKNNVLHDLGAFFGALVSAAPPAQASVLSSTASTLASAGNSVTAAIPALAVAGANAAMNLVPGAAGFEPLADMVIEAIIAELQTRKSTAASPVAPAVAPSPLFQG